MRSAEAELFKDKIEVSLDGRQIFYLFFGGAVVASLVFVLGVMVGKRVEARAHVGVATTTAEMDPLAALDQLSMKDGSGGLAFPSALGGGQPQPLGAVDQALAERQARDDARAQRERAEAEKQAEAARRAAEAKQAEAAKKAEAEKRAAEAKPAEAPKPAAEAKKADVAKPAAEPKKAEPKFTLQISSFQDRSEAEAFRTKIAGAGYDPYVVEATVPEKGTWYRVRLGKYPSYDDALAGKKKFEDDQQIIAYVTRIK